MQARRTVEEYWQERLAHLVGPGRLAGALARTAARYPALRLLLPRPDRRTD
ncbi:hypothetical protein [Kitasatospora griseola]|uniref:hypothetical protein n=1 Tax=Kitasatospora griseola TaxID=2064 RepID=UPI003666134C